MLEFVGGFFNYLHYERGLEDSAVFKGVLFILSFRIVILKVFTERSRAHVGV